ncbi:baculoviral IAP repeat-containing protein 3-like [Ciona intestinalis]
MFSTSNSSSLATNQYDGHEFIQDNLTSDIEVDGRISQRINDPPGQKSLYILPGDTEREIYRLTTYIKYPQNAPIDVVLLAKHGFYYTGYKDRVKCFSCGVCIDGWSIGDDPTSERWHFTNCDLVNGKDERNVPVASLLKGRKPKIEFSKSDNISSTDVSDHNSQRSIEHISMESAEQGNDNAAQQVLQSDKSSAPTDVTNMTQTLSKIQIQNKKANNVSNASGNKSPSEVYMTARYVPPAIPNNPGLNFASIVDPLHKQLLSEMQLCKESERRRSFDSWSTAFSVEYVEALARSGFFYLGNLDRTQCFSCSGVLRNWRSADNIDSEHIKHFPHCKLMVGTEDRNISLPVGNDASSSDGMPEPADPDQEEQHQLAKMFPLKNPVNSSMKNMSSRLSTFERWPRHKTVATPNQIAKSGFFYLGDRDRAKCWYCNGGLQNWALRDEPWTEHAKWYPGCEFVLRSKGIQFVRDIYLKDPNIPRPEISNGRTEYLDPLVLSPASASHVPSAGDVLAHFSPPPPDAVERMPTTGSYDIDAEMGSEIVLAAQTMGFQPIHIRLVVERHFAEHGVGYQTVASLIDAMLSYDDQAEAEEAEATPVGLKRNNISINHQNIKQQKLNEV